VWIRSHRTGRGDGGWGNAADSIPTAAQSGNADANYNGRMVAVRYVALLALVVWLGGMVMLGAVVAPSTFRVLQAADPAAGRVLAGALFGEILRLFHLLAYACGALIILALVVMKFVGPPPPAVIA